MQKLNIILVFIVLWLAGAAPSYGQRHELGAGVGVWNYKGELAPYINYQSPRLGFSVLWRQNWNGALSTRLSFSHGNIEAHDSDLNTPLARRRQYSFQTELSELAAILEYNFFYYRNPCPFQGWSPYLLMGVAAFRMNPAQNISPDYSLYQLSVPMGVGMKVVLGKHWNLNAEVGARKTFTDYLDDLYTNKRLLPARPAKYYTGNTYDKDWYFFSAIHLTYTFYAKPCPSFYKF